MEECTTEVQAQERHFALPLLLHWLEFYHRATWSYKEGEGHRLCVARNGCGSSWPSELQTKKSVLVVPPQIYTSNRQ